MTVFYKPLAAPLCAMTIFISLLLCSNHALAFDVGLGWDESGDAEVAGYMIHYGEESGNYTAKVDAGQSTAHTIAGLLDGRTYYFAVTAYDLSRNESGYSNEVSRTVISGEQNTTSLPGPASGAMVAGANGAGVSGGGGGGCSIGSGGSDASLPLLAGIALLSLTRRLKRATNAQKQKP